MAEFDYGAVQVLVALLDASSREDVAGAFWQAGFLQVIEATSPEELRKAFGMTSFDLVVMEGDLGGASTMPVLQALRRGELGAHPFPLVMTLLEEGQPETVRHVINCGPDDVLLMPVQPEHILARVEVLAQGRRPFVVAPDYTGPDRRACNRGDQKAPHFNVPNPLRAHATGVPDTVLDEQIATARKHLDQAHLERCAHQLRWLKRNILLMFQDRNVDPGALRSHSLRLKQISKDLPRHAGHQNAARFTELAASLAADVDAVISVGADANHAQLSCVSDACSGLLAELARLPPPVLVGTA